MTTGPARVEAIPVTSERKTCASDHREPAIESLAQLLSSGRPVSKILDDAKRRAENGRFETTAPDDAKLAPGSAMDSKLCAGAERPEPNITERLRETIAGHINIKTKDEVFD